MIKLCLWFEDEAEEAAKFYTSIFADSSIGLVSRFGPEGAEHHRQPVGKAMAVEFRILNMEMIAINGRRGMEFNDSASISVGCKTQEEIDYYWAKLSDEGSEGHCGWLKDRFGVSWQITPECLPEYMADPDADRRARVATAVFGMMKIDINALVAAHDGK